MAEPWPFWDDALTVNRPCTGNRALEQLGENGALTTKGARPAASVVAVVLVTGHAFPPNANATGRPATGFPDPLVSVAVNARVDPSESSDCCTLVGASVNCRPPGAAPATLLQSRS